LPFIFKKYKFNYDFSFEVSRLRKSIKENETQNSNNLQAYIPDYINTQYYQLPFFKEASRYLKDRYQFKVYDQKRATLLNYKSNAGKAAILNIMGHSLTNLNSSETLSIAIDSSNGSDLKFLSPIQIIKTPLNADLTVLSLCESGLGDEMITNGYFNLVYWFTYAGSKSCLYSYWKLDDRSTAFILERFFHYLSLGMIKSSALTNAKNDYLAQTKTEEERNPVYWGGLALIGDDSPILITENKKTDYWYLTLFTIPLLFYFYKVRNKIKIPRKLP
jgi:CHAT domain-containing protein